MCLGSQVELGIVYGCICSGLLVLLVLVVVKKRDVFYMFILSLLVFVVMFEFVFENEMEIICTFG